MKKYIYIILFLLSTLLISPAFAAIIELAPGDSVYIGETADISRVMSWSDQFAMWDIGYPASSHPDHIVDASLYGHMYDFNITADRGFSVGHWYKWDGYLESNGNMDAFIIKPGTRPHVNVTPFVNLSSISSNGTIKVQNHIHILVAQGDLGTFQFKFPENASQHSGELGYIWLFGSTPETTYSNGRPLSPNTILQKTLSYNLNTSAYTYNITPKESQNLEAGKYTGFFQFVGNNSRPEVYYVPDKNNLDSPWKAVDAINLDGMVCTQIQQDFVNMESNATYTDDILVPITMDLVSPSLSIGDYWESNGFLTVSGSTPLSEGTEIKIMLDPDQYVLPQDIRFHTFSTFARPSDIIAVDDPNCYGAIAKLNQDGYNTTPLNLTENGSAMDLQINESGFFLNGTEFYTPTETPFPTQIPTQDTVTPLRNIITTKEHCTEPPRVYKVGIPVVWDEMFIGQHTLFAKLVTPTNETATMSKDFVVSGSWYSPTPTMIFQKQIFTKEGNLAEETPTPNQTENITSVLERMETVTPTETPNPNETIVAHPQVTPMATPPPTVSTEETPDATIDLAGLGLPIDPVVPLLAIGVVLVFIVLKRR